MQNDFFPLCRSENILTQELGDEILIYDLTGDRAFCLNRSCMMIWQECDGRKSVREIAGILSGKLNVKVTEEFIWLALGQLDKEKLMQDAPPVPASFAGLSRREAIRRVGLASIAALPVITSLLAPTAIMAASPCGAPVNRPRGCGCQRSTQCRPGDCCRADKNFVCHPGNSSHCVRP